MADLYDSLESRDPAAREQALLSALPALLTRAMQAPDALALCGGTDVYPAHAGKALSRPLVDLSRVEGLRGITQGSGEIRIGAATTWSDIIKADLPPAFDAHRPKAFAKKSRSTTSCPIFACSFSPSASNAFAVSDAPDFAGRIQHP
jgi:hypothetical protein